MTSTPPAPTRPFAVEKLGTWTVFRFAQRDLFPAPDDGMVLRTRLLQQLDLHGRDQIFLDLTDINWLGGAFFSAIVLLYRRLRQDRGRLAIGGIAPGVRELFLITKIDRLIDLRAGVWQGEPDLPESTAAAFLDAIRATPDDDAPRLIYADWLEETGDEDRAEFIRLQCARASSGEQAELAPREQLLLDRHQHDWVNPIGALVASLRWRRGFIDEVSLSGPAFRGHVELLFRLAPIRQLRIVPLHGDPLQLQEVLDRPVLENLYRLDLQAVPISSADVPWLLDSPLLQRLPRLRLSSTRLTPQEHHLLSEQFGDRLEW
jgi:uncharacterized protein (TIGR02996 family)